MAHDYKDELRRTILASDSFVRLTAKGRLAPPELPWQRVLVRPVGLKSGRHLQFSYFSATQDITKNYRGDQATAKLEELLALPFSSFHLQMTDGDLQVQVPTSGKVLLHRTRRDAPADRLHLMHDRGKDLLLPANRPDPFLQAIGIMSRQGTVLASMHGKFRQVNEFLKLLEHAGIFEPAGEAPLHILDCGSGSAYLSLATYHYLTRLKGVPATLTGIDTNASLIDKSNSRAAQLGFDEARFMATPISSYVPAEPPDIVLGLHACDTATDDAIALGILHGARAIVCAPCCHHHLQQQLGMVAPFQPVLEQGILKKRQGDILTDALRALILRIMGYTTDVVEFVSPEHTDRNLMIRAVKRPQPDRERLLGEYVALTSFWSVTPYLQKVLEERGRWPAADGSAS